ncbi:MAG: hypothetical protein WB798_04615, partial [Nocardioidaceae bacterium]
LPRWARLLRPGGRIGVSTFGAQDDVWRQVDALFAPHLPPGMLDPRTRGSASPFASDEGVAALLSGAGFVAVETVCEPIALRLSDAEQWRAWTMGTGQRMMWGFVPEGERDGLFSEAARLLEQARDGEWLVLHQDVRYTVARVP